MDVVAVFGTAVHSAWLLPVLALLIAVDGPVPALPSETLLLTALAVALAGHDGLMLAGLFVAAVAGSVAGDLLVFGLGRSSQRMVSRSVDVEVRLARWIRRNLLHRPGMAMVGARFLPCGRLLSCAAAGRYGLPLMRFAPWSVVSSAVWTLYMTAIAMIINPLADGSPVAALLAGIAVAVLTAGVCAAARYGPLRRGLRSAARAGKDLALARN